LFFNPDFLQFATVVAMQRNYVFCRVKDVNERICAVQSTNKSSLYAIMLKAIETVMLYSENYYDFIFDGFTFTEIIDLSLCDPQSDPRPIDNLDLMFFRGSKTFLDTR
jgi:hypothetical protein